MKFNSPDDLWKYSLALSSVMMVKGYKEQAKILESKTRLPCTTGWEWLSEMYEGIGQISKMGKLPEDINEKLSIILKTVKSETPYG